MASSDGASARLTTGTIIEASAGPESANRNCRFTLARAGFLLVRQGRTGDGDDADEFLQSRVVGWVRGVEGKVFRDGGGCDHEVCDPPARLAAHRDDGGGHPPVDPGRLSVERDGVKLALGALQGLGAAGTFLMLVV